MKEVMKEVKKEVKKEVRKQGRKEGKEGRKGRMVIRTESSASFTLAFKSLFNILYVVALISAGSSRLCIYSIRNDRRVGGG